MEYKNETLVSQNLASELVNQTREYRQYKKIYTLADKTISQNTLLEMFKFSGVFKPSFIVEYIAKVSFSMTDLALMDRINSDHNIPKLEQSIQKIKIIKKDSDDVGCVRYDDVGYKYSIYKKPIFSRNLVEVNFVDKDDSHDYLNRFHFRFTSHHHRPLKVLNNNCNVLENDTLTFNEALFMLLGFNTVLAPDYEIINSAHPIDEAMLRTEQGQKLNAKRFDKNRVDTKDFLEWAANNNFIRKKTTNKKTITRDKSIKQVEEALLTYLPTLDKKTNKNALAFGREHETFSDQFDFPPSTLLAYLTVIITPEWWTNQEKDIQNKIKKPKK